MKKFTLHSIFIGCILAFAAGTVFSQSQAALDFAAKESIPVAQIQEIGQAALVDNHITVSQTWDGIDAILNSNLVIDAGVELIIRNSLIGLQANQYITVMPRAKLTLENSRITNASSLPAGRWMSIFVGGNPNSYAEADQGLLTIHYSTIENAKTAVYNYVVLNNMSMINTDGGLVRALDGKFSNNICDVLLYAPVYTGQSYFYNCIFELTSVQSITPGVDNCRVGLTNTNNTVFGGCTFSRRETLDANPTGASYGISAYKAKFTVDNSCICPHASGTPCPELCVLRSSFYNFDYGIYADGGTALVKPTPTAIIRNTQFIENKIGAKLVNMHFPDFSGCEATIPISSNTYGLYMDNCRYYKIQNNIFQPVKYTDPIRKNIGISVNNSYRGSHQIYRNQFSGLRVGVAIAGDNSGIDNYTDGLKLNCNVFEKCTYDIAMGDLSGQQVTVAFDQGDPNAAGVLRMVRNIYGAECVDGNKWYVYNSTKNIYHPCTAGESTAPVPQPECSSLLLLIDTFYYKFFYPRDCPDQMNTGILQDLDTQISDLSNKLSTYNGSGLNTIAAANEILRNYNHLPKMYSDNQTLAEAKQAGEYAAISSGLQNLVNEKIRQNLQLGTPEGDAAARSLIEMYKSEEADNITPAASKREQLEIDFQNAVAADKQALHHRLMTYKEPEIQFSPDNNKSFTPASFQSTIGKESRLSIYPNPAQNNITFEYSGELKGNMNIEITDVTGRLVRSLDFTGNQVHYSVTDLPQNLYFATLKMNGTVIETQKIVLSK